MDVQNKIYDLRERRPKVLLVGNGLIKNTGLSWDDLIKRTARAEVDLSVYQKENETGSSKTRFIVPYGPLAMAISDFEDDKRHQKYCEVLNQLNYTEIPLLQELVRLPFDAILTTNYTYEVENVLHDGFSALNNCTKRKKSESFYRGKGRDTYLLQRYNKVGPEAPEIWHIHGEASRKSSIVLTHDEYARLITAVLTYMRQQKNHYEQETEQFVFHSWIDYILMADVFILGLGLDYSEFDLWWLLGRRKRERAECGKVLFYEPDAEACRGKHAALKELGVRTESCGFHEDQIKGYKNTDAFYQAFYRAASADIKNRLLRQAGPLTALQREKEGIS